MPLGAADLTRIYRYKAYQLGDVSPDLTSGDVLTMLQQQINQLNAADTAKGTTFAALIQADLDAMDTLDTSVNTGAASDGIKVLGIGSGIEYFEGGATKGFAQEMNRLRLRVARVLSQTYEGVSSSGVGMAYRG